MNAIGQQSEGNPRALGHVAMPITARALRQDSHHAANAPRSMPRPAVHRRCLAITLLAFSFAGCRRSPVIDVLGSYFPAWLICIVVGLVPTIISREVFIALKLNKHLHPAAIVYPCLLIVFTLAFWLTFFQS
jgi:hypothetical protein